MARHVADQLNKTFVQDVYKLTQPLQHLQHRNRVIGASVGTFQFPRFTPDEVARNIGNFTASASVGSDGISVKMLQMSEKAIAAPLCNIFNCSIAAGYFPSAWKTGIVVPVYKKGDRYNMSNYRPITILPIISRLFERIVIKSLSSYLDKHHVIANNQHGFRKLHSCETALLSLLDNWYKQIDKGATVVAAALDYTKAFDTIQHGLLIHKLTEIGINGIALNWFQSYLYGRQQCVRYDETLSSCLPITSGVPQGSVLGPVLFIIYINDLLRMLPNSVAYADDLTVYSYGATYTDAVNSINLLLDNVASWSRQNGLTLSLQKCVHIVIKRNIRKAKSAASPTSNTGTDLPVVLLLGYPLAAVSELKLLGVMLQSNLEWTAHVNTVKRKISQKLAVLRRFGSHLDSTKRLLVYNTFIRPHALYCAVVWGNSQSVSHISSINVLLNRAIHIILPGLKTIDNKSRQFTCIHDFSAVIKFLTVIRVHRFMYCLTDTGISFKTIASIHNCNTRSSVSLKIVPPKINFKTCKSCFTFAGAKSWNLLPYEFTKINDYILFLRAVREHFHLVRPNKYK
jgi:hypothetical protein